MHRGTSTRRPARGDGLSNGEWAILRSTEGAAWRRVGTQAGTVSRTLRLCTAAKSRGVVIFTIGFEIDRIDTASGRERARELMGGCASSPTHYFDVKSVSIAEAFANIASQIEQLRLTR